MRLGIVLLVLCGLAFLLVGKVEPSRTQRPVASRHRVVRARPHPRKPTPSPKRPPQFVVVSFDGSGGVRLWPYWRAVARRAGARFTFFVSGVYLVPDTKRLRYRPPRHSPGSSDIGFAQS